MLKPGAMEKITYASLGNLGEDFHRAFDAALIHERKKLGDTHPMFINGKPVKAGKTFIDFNPAHRDAMMGKFQSGSREHVRKAVTAARNAAPFIVAARGWAPPMPPRPPVTTSLPARSPPKWRAPAAAKVS